jgi:hypothetical protein
MDIEERLKKIQKDLKINNLPKINENIEYLILKVLKSFLDKNNFTLSCMTYGDEGDIWLLWGKRIYIHLNSNEQIYYNDGEITIKTSGKDSIIEFQQILDLLKSALEKMKSL